jgi:3-hydroxybutyrate dehydrogenase
VTRPWNGAHVVITGAGGAIGSALARRIRAKAGSARLSLVDVTKEAASGITMTVGGEAAAFGWDLSRPDDLPEHVSALLDARGDVDVLVNCAGIMEVQSIASMPWELGSRVLKIDLESPMRLMSLLVPRMIERRRGLIVNVASMAGKTPLRGCSYYGAAKAGIAMASEIARLELKSKGVDVVTVLPGPVRSGLESHARAAYPESAVTRFIPTGDAEELAVKIVDACERKRARVVYPAFYDAAHRVPQLAEVAAEILSPHPRR